MAAINRFFVWMTAIMSNGLMEFQKERSSRGTIHSSNVLAFIDVGFSDSNSGSCDEGELDTVFPVVTKANCRTVWQVCHLNR